MSSIILILILTICKINTENVTIETLLEKQYDTFTIDKNIKISVVEDVSMMTLPVLPNVTEGDTEVQGSNSGILEEVKESVETMGNVSVISPVVITPEYFNEETSNVTKEDTEVQVSNSSILEQFEESVETMGNVGVISPNVTTPGYSNEVTYIDIVQTTLGPVRGYLLYDNLDILSYIDVPYGRSTGLANAPKEAEAWEEIHQVSSHTKVCLQLDKATGSILGDEDCLTLSVFVPKNTVNAGVLFHIHDGDYIENSGDLNYYGPEYLVPKDLILVLPNYRLGPFGFLCLQDDDAPGNAGLKDLALALKWTVNNIRKFGGDPKKITVSGEGSASALVGLLALSPQTRDLFNKAIMESGSPLAHWALDRNPIETATKLINSFLNNDANETVALSDRNHTEILKASEGIHFRPCIENGQKAFLNQLPWRILTNEQIRTKFLIGTASDAGSHDAIELNAEYLALLNENNTLLIPEDLSFVDDKVKDEEAERIKCQYFGVGDLHIDEVERLTLYYTDMSYLSPALRTARSLIDAGATVYFYEFSFLGAFNRKALSLPYVTDGAVKGDVVGYLFAQNYEYPNEESTEYEKIDIMTDLWASFINYGVPASEGITWTKLNKTSEESEAWLSIGAKVESKQGLHVERMNLWTELYRDHFIDNKGARIRLSKLTISMAIGLMIIGTK